MSRRQSLCAVWIVLFGLLTAACGGSASVSDSQTGDASADGTIGTDAAPDDADEHQDVTLRIDEPGQGNEVSALELFPLKIGTSWDDWRIDGIVHHHGRTYYRAVCSGRRCDLVGAVTPVVYLAHSESGLLVGGVTQYGWLKQPIVLLPSLVRDGMRWTTASFPAAGRPETMQLNLRNLGERPTGIGPREFWQLAVQIDAAPLVPGTTAQSLVHLLLARGLGPSHRQVLSGVDGPGIDRPIATTTLSLPAKATPFELSDFTAANSPIRFSLMQRPSEAPVLLVRAYEPCGTSTPLTPRCEKSACFQLTGDGTVNPLAESVSLPQSDNLLLTSDGSLCPRSAADPGYQGYSAAYALTRSEGVYFYPVSPVLGSTRNSYTLLGDETNGPVVWLADSEDLTVNAWDTPLTRWDGALSRLYLLESVGVAPFHGLAVGDQSSVTLYTWLTDGKLFQLQVDPSGPSLATLAGVYAGQYLPQQTAEGVRFTRATIDGEILSLRADQDGLRVERLAQIGNLPDDQLLVAAFRYLDPTTDLPMLWAITEQRDVDRTAPPTFKSYQVPAPTAESLSTPALSRVWGTPAGYDYQLCWEGDLGTVDFSDWTLAGLPPAGVIRSDQLNCALVIRDVQTLSFASYPFSGTAYWGVDGRLPGQSDALRVIKGSGTYFVTAGNALEHALIIAALSDGRFVTDKLVLDNTGAVLSGHAVALNGLTDETYTDAAGLGIWRLPSNNNQWIDLIGATQRSIPSPKLPEWGSTPQWHISGLSRKGGVILQVDAPLTGAQFFYHIDKDGQFNALPEPPTGVVWRVQLSDGTLCGYTPDLSTPVLHCRDAQGQLSINDSSGLSGNQTALWYPLRDDSVIFLNGNAKGIQRFLPSTMAVAPLTDQSPDFRSLRYGYDGSLVAKFGNTLMFIEPDGLKDLPTLPDNFQERRPSLFIRGRDVDLVFFSTPYDGMIRLLRH